MAARAHVPQFGKWDNEEEVPYTVYFDNARKGRGGKMINPNDPQENPEMFRQFAPPAPSRSRHQIEETVGRGAVRSSHERHRSREDGNMRRRVSSDSPHHHYGHGSHSRQSAGSEHSFEQSPMHSYHPAKVSGRGGTSPAWDGKGPYDNMHGTHGKSRRKPVTRVEESPDRGAAVPRFGDWDESNPQSADSYTHIFNRVREERNTPPPNLPGNKFESSDDVIHKQNASSNRKACCFPWLGK